MKKLFSIMSVTLLLMIAAVNTANAQSFSITAITPSLVGTWDGSGTIYLNSSDDYGAIDLICNPNDPSYKYVWSVQGYSGTPCQIYPNLTYSPFARLYIWPPYTINGYVFVYGYGYADVACEVYNSAGTKLGTVYFGVGVTY